MIKFKVSFFCDNKIEECWEGLAYAEMFGLTVVQFIDGGIGDDKRPG